MNIRSFILCSIMIGLLAGSAEAQLLRKNKHPEKPALRHGKYFEYWDADSSRISARGYFDQGRPSKTWKYYHQDGTRRMKVKYREKLKIKYYSQKGTLEKKGHAVLDLDPERIHFYWDGIWKYYDPRRKLYRISMFKMGEETMVIFGPEDPIFFDL